MNATGLSEFIIGDSPAIRTVREQTVTLAAAESPVLIQGQTGSGKELVAQALHTMSGRRGAFVALNVSTIPEAMFESMVFGHVRGAFTNAIADKPGYLDEAHNGTVFFDEIGDLACSLQPKLLRAIETRTYRPVGAARDRESEFRLVSATNRNLLSLLEEGSFRADLAERLRTFIIDVPPLAERRDDIPMLSEHFAINLAHRTQSPHLRFTAEAIEALQTHSWPRNVRELKNVVERLHVLSHHRSVHAPDVVRAIEQGQTFRQATPAYELQRGELQALLERAGWDTADVALMLGVNRSTVYRRMRRLGIPRRRP